MTMLENVCFWGFGGPGWAFASAYIFNGLKEQYPEINQAFLSTGVLLIPTKEGYLASDLQIQIICEICMVLTLLSVYM